MRKTVVHILIAVRKKFNSPFRAGENNWIFGRFCLRGLSSQDAHGKEHKKGQKSGVFWN